MRANAIWPARCTTDHDPNVIGHRPEWIPTLDNFVAGRNVELLAALRHALAADKGERGLYLWGETGSGRSHLLQAAIGHARAMGQSAIYACGEVPEAAQVVAVDAVETLDDAAQVALFALYNRQRESGGMLLVSGTQAPTFLDIARRSPHAPGLGAGVSGACPER